MCYTLYYTLHTAAHYCIYTIYTLSILLQHSTHTRHYYIAYYYYYYYILYFVNFIYRRIYRIYLHPSTVLRIYPLPYSVQHHPLSSTLLPFVTATLVKSTVFVFISTAQSKPVEGAIVEVSWAPGPHFTNSHPRATLPPLCPLVSLGLGII